nr:MAG TPA: hypothetical protein [Caudoviricetes sp.]
MTQKTKNEIKKAILFVLVFFGAAFFLLQLMN